MPSKYNPVNDKDPVWMNENITSKIKKRNLLYRQCIQSNIFESDFVLLETFIAELNELISSAKDLCYENLGKKLNNPLLQAKAYWSILKTFYKEKKFC